MIRRVLQHSIFAFGRSWCGHSTIVAVLSFGMAACTRLPHSQPRAIPTTPPELTIDVIEIPDTVCVSDTVTLVIRTAPGNECLGDIGYWNSNGSWVGPSFDPIAADKQGTCQFKYRFVLDRNWSPSLCFLDSINRRQPAPRSLACPRLPMPRLVHRGQV